MKTVLTRWLLPGATGALLAAAYPPFNVAEAAWVGLIPLLFALEECPRGEAFRRGYIAGLVFFGGTVWWIACMAGAGTPWPAALMAAVGLAAFLALYWGAAAAWFAMLMAAQPGESAAANLLRAGLGTAGWVTLEWVRGTFPLGGFPWNFLGVSQHRAAPLIQFASVTGVYGISAMLCFVNIAFYATLRRFWRKMTRPSGERWRLSWEFYAAMLVVCAAFLQGMRTILHRAPPRTELALALVQGNIPQSLKFDPNQGPMIFERYRTLTETAMLGGPDLIVWPETATPEPLRYDPESWALVTNLARQSGAYLMTGSVDYTPGASPLEGYNAVFLVRPDGSLADVYHKIQLVPFGEYVPLRKLLPWMEWLTPIPGSFERGRRLTVFHLEKPEAAGTMEGWKAGPSRSSSSSRSVSFAAVICFEDTMPGLCRRFAQRGVDFLVNVTNDAWFQRSPAAEMHLANARFRAIENRRPLVRATNNGVTCVVDEFGFIRSRLDPFTEGSLFCRLAVPGDRSLTFYTRHGDWFVAVCAVAAVLAGWWMRWTGRAKKQLT